MSTQNALLGDTFTNAEPKNQKILIVDDFDNVRKSIKGMLHELGYEYVYEAGEANSAMKAIKEINFSLILCDFNLGKGRDGARLLEEWRVKKLIGQETVFVMITADTSRELVTSTLEFEPDDYLAKPFAMDVLAGRLERWFERRRVLLPLLVCAEQAQWPELCQLAREIEEEHPRYRSFAQKMYAESLIEQEKLTEAENFLLGLLEQRYQSWVKIDLHEIEFIQNKYASAAKGLKEVLVNESTAMAAYDLLARIYKETENRIELQALLEKAIIKAPRNIRRNLELARVAKQNLDMHRSNKAYKAAIALAEGTMHEELGNYQKLVDGLETESELGDSTENRKREIYKDLMFVSKKMSERFPGNINARLFNVALKIRKAESEDQSTLNPKLDELYKELFSNVDQVIPDTAFYIAETFYFNGRFEDADEIVKRLRVQFKGDVEFKERLDELQADPVSIAKRKEAHDLNVQGIEKYKRKEYVESLELFAKALRISPNHPGMILNFVQSKLQTLRTLANPTDDVKKCSELLQRIDHLPEQHYQYDRYAKLRKTVKKIIQES
ncbi:response regulator [Reinekea forsetii]|nr:response regulator [Reinekea forsetii]